MGGTAIRIPASSREKTPTLESDQMPVNSH